MPDKSPALKYRPSCLDWLSLLHSQWAHNGNTVCQRNTIYPVSQKVIIQVAILTSQATLMGIQIWKENICGAPTWHNLHFKKKKKKKCCFQPKIIQNLQMHQGGYLHFLPNKSPTDPSGDTFCEGTKHSGAAVRVCASPCK